MSMPKDPSVHLCLVLTILISSCCPAAASTYITERLVPFDLPPNDLSVAVQKQLSRDDFLTAHFTTDHVAVTKLVYKATYNGAGRIVDPPYESFKHVITKDSIDVVVTYHAVVHPKLPTKKNYNGTTSLKIYLNYTKEIELASETTKIQGLNTYVDPASFRMSYTNSPSASDKKLLDYVNKGSLGDGNVSIYYLLQHEEFSSQITLKYFLENLVSQKLSPTYDAVYTYHFQALTATFDMTTAKLENIQHGVAHSMKGSINNYYAPAQQFSQLSRAVLKASVETAEKASVESAEKVKIDNQVEVESAEEVGLNGDGGEQFHTQFTVGFITNFINYNIEQNKDWRNYFIDRKRYDTTAFRFRLVDLEFIADGFSQKYAQYYLNDLLFTCNPQALANLANAQPQNYLYVGLQWTCKCNLLGLTPYPTLLDFDITAEHLLSVKINGDKLAVYIEESRLQAWEFREVEGISVVDQGLAALHLEGYLKKVLGQAVGTGFKIKAGSTRVVFRQQSGLWIG